MKRVVGGGRTDLYTFLLDDCNLAPRNQCTGCFILAGVVRGSRFGSSLMDWLVKRISVAKSCVGAWGEGVVLNVLKEKDLAHSHGTLSSGILWFGSFPCCSVFGPEGVGWGCIFIVGHVVMMSLFG